MRARTSLLAVMTTVGAIAGTATPFAVTGLAAGLLPICGPAVDPMTTTVGSGSIGPGYVGGVSVDSITVYGQTTPAESTGSYTTPGYSTQPQSITTPGLNTPCDSGAGSS
jgi:sugar (pentulose or hexulose) kinase